MNVSQKLIAAHLVDGQMKPGEEIGLRIDQTLTQDATGTMVMLELEAMHVDRVKTGGIGLRNVNERLRVIYGANYQLQLDSVPGEGTCARVVIPELVVPARITA